MNDSLLSVIIPVYNKGEAIKRGLDSIVDQTYSHWEVEIVDDGSTDNSVEYIKPYLLDSRFHYYYKENGGVSSARNYGLNKAQGKYIIFLDADDYFLPRAFEILLLLIKQEKVNVGTANFFIEKGGDRRLFSYLKEQKIFKNNFRAWLFEKMCPRAGAAIFLRDVVVQYPFDESLSRYEDAKSLFDIMREEKIAYSPFPVMVYNQDDLGLSCKLEQIRKDFISHLEFAEKGFWEKLLLARLLNGGFHCYPNCKKILKNKYGKYFKYCIMDRVLSLYICVMKCLFNRLKMKIIKRLIKYCILKIRLRNKVVFSFSVNIALSSKFEGMNKLHEHSSFCGKMGFGSYLGPNSYVVGNIGRFTSIAPFVRCNSGVHPYKLPYVTTSPSFYSLNLNHSQNGSTFAKQQMFKEHMFVDNDNKWIVNIGHDCWIGEHVFMVGGVTVNNGAVVLAHAVVTKDVPPYAIVGGIPAKVIGYRYDEETIAFLLKKCWWNNEIKWFEKHWMLLNDMNLLKAYYGEKTNDK